jgi:hypothetical protein
VWLAELFGWNNSRFNCAALQKVFVDGLSTCPDNGRLRTLTDQLANEFDFDFVIMQDTLNNNAKARVSNK